MRLHALAIGMSCTVWLAACAPASVVERLDDRRVGTQIAVGRGRNRTLVATARSTPSGADLAVTARHVCDQYEEASLHRVQVTTRKANVAGTVVFYLAAAAGAGIGAGILGDAHNVAASGDLTMKNPVGRTGAYAIGGVISGLGLIALGVGIGTSVRGRDSVRDLGIVRARVQGTTQTVTCNWLPAASMALVLDVGGNNIDAGTTDAAGKANFSWDRLEALASTGQVTSTGTLKTVEGEDLGSVDLLAARSHWAGVYLASATLHAEHDEVEQATKSVERAQQLGADVTNARARIAAAPTTLRREKERQAKETAEAEAKQEQARRHIETAKTHLRHSDLDAADTELTKAKELGGDVDALAGKLVTMMSTKAISGWKRHIAQCRKVATVRGKIENMSHCDGDCQQIKQKVNKEWERLGAVKLPVDVLSSEQVQSIKDQCEQAGCPDCP